MVFFLLFIYKRRLNTTHKLFIRLLHLNQMWNVNEIKITKILFKLTKFLVNLAIIQMNQREILLIWI